MSEEVWAIRWESGHKSGTGGFRFTKERAERIAAELNSEYPSIRHWIINAGPLMAMRKEPAQAPNSNQ